jgi:hypothetical protein
MLRLSDAHHRFHSAHQRFFKPAIEEFFRKEFPSLFGPNMVSRVADELINIFNQHHSDIKTLQPGQMLWRAVHKDTRADSPNRRFVSVVLTIVSPHDIRNLEKKDQKRKYRQAIIARIMRQAYEQDALLSTRDIGLILATNDAYISTERIAFETEYHTSLPHTGNLHDMGSCITHKRQIVYKYVIEKKDPLIIAKETNHSLRAVDHYLKDYNRVKLLFQDNKNPDYIKIATGLPKHVINQYINIINLC